MGIKNATRDDVLAARRTLPLPPGIVPAQGSTFGKPTEAVNIFFELEIERIQARLFGINEAVVFAPRRAPVPVS
ncbi:Capsid portal protein (fragment) [Sphingomonas aurantiaca]|uniref:Capsid portal protein n=1 Tax=Sphingomonas aurantiaca TaxID=185949 RepID=A0A5E8A5V9_9SPHN